jgi:hypothetical protein
MIYIECNADRALVKCVTKAPKREILHELKGKYEICIQLAKKRNCKGLIDEDPEAIEPPYVRKLRQAGKEKILPECELRVLYDTANSNSLVILCPRLEEWILKAAREAGLDVRRYNLSSDGAKLHGQINLRLDKFVELLEDLKSQSSRRLSILKTLMESSEQ